jgi:ankyrin repeat protein
MAETLDDRVITAADAGDEEAVARLLDAGAPVDAIVNGRYNWTPLMHAAWRGHLAVVRLLLTRGANVNHECHDGFTALTLATDRGYWEIVKHLAEQGGDVTHCDATGNSALSVARRRRKAHLVAFLQQFASS